MNNQIIDAKISDIKIGTRFRKDMGDIEGFAQSIEETDLLHAIGITPDYELIFGERRLRAYRDVLHRDTIPAHRQTQVGPSRTDHRDHDAQGLHDHRATGDC